MLVGNAPVARVVGVDVAVIIGTDNVDGAEFRERELWLGAPMRTPCWETGSDPHATTMRVTHAAR